MAFNAGQFRKLINETLEISGFTMGQPAAVELLLMTAAVESNFGTYIEQIEGPALGPFQVEPATHDDLVWRYLPGNPRHFKGFWKFCLDFVGCRVEAETMRYNLAYSIIIARLKYLSIPAALPLEKDLGGLAAYWKRYYNTHLGSGTVEQALLKYRQYCL